MQRCSIANFTKDTKRVANFTSSVARMEREGFLATEKVEIFPCSRAFNCLRSTLKRCNLGVGACLRILLQPTTYYVRSNLHSVPLSFFTLWTRPWEPLLQSHSWSSPHLGSYVVGPPQCSNPLHAFQSSFGSCWILASAYILLSVHTHNETLDTTFLLSYKYHKGLLNIRLSLPALYKSCLGMKTFIMGEQLTLGSYYITDANVAKYASDICLGDGYH